MEMKYFPCYGFPLHRIFSKPAIIFIRVILPVLFGASIPNYVPSSTRKDTRSSMILRCVPVQNDLLTLLNSNILHPLLMAHTASYNSQVNASYGIFRANNI